MFNNWLSSDLSSPPDIVIEVGPPPFTRFPVHSSVLTIHSGYLRAAVIRAEESPIKSLENLIFLPNITVEQFAPLLTYMYTGFLDLNLENIFGVLLATHLLHMPQALEICRNFLTRQQQEHVENYMRQFSSSSTSSAPTTPKVIRPIASKASNSTGLNFVSPPSLTSNTLVPSHETSFKSIGSEKVVVIQEVQEPLKIENVEKSVKKHKSSHPPSQTSTVVAPKKLNSNEENEFSANDKVIIDIASCDGPVRFRRVLNEAYDINKNLPSFEGNDSKSDLKSSFKNSSAKSFHQQMARNINEQYLQNLSSNVNSEESENSQHSANLSNSEIYTCVYCKHTFKSQYCYQKHAKRHLNPLNMKNAKCSETPSENEYLKIKLNEEIQKISKRDSIKPLDMNVQYYPCKTCGCKFPSYYFVHKHRKICHPELLEENQQTITNQAITINEENKDENSNSNNSTHTINVDEKDSD